ncbi:MAG: glycosyltransferase family 2 protein [Candidatus Woesearchaeota archaeon]
MKQLPVLAIVIPCYNEEEVIRETAKNLLVSIKNLIKNSQINEKSFLLFVDDGSKDKTWSIIKELNRNYKNLRGIKLSKNCGHQNALFAGLMEAKKDADCVISIDADLQDDIKVIPKFIEEYKAGNDIVYGVRKKRDKDSFFKKWTALFFYKLMKYLGVQIIENHADYRLASRRALEALEKFEERNLFLRGIFPLLGFESSFVYYDRKERFAGKTKYPIKKMLSFAFEGITSFSLVPLRVVGVIGLFVFFFSIAMILYAIELKISGKAIPGWASTVTPIYFIGGIQLITLGIIGEYIGKTYLETKKRPRYIIEEEVK